jgi:indolepyruvate ferredoxin oxidoreductase beta subunit
MTYNILMTGVGGQGLMSLAAMIGEACVASGIQVVTQEQHGLAQRSGSISAHIRIGVAYSPMVPYGTADLIISMEATEALRYIEYLKTGGTIVSSSRLMHPVIETNKIVANRRENLEYVTLEAIKENLVKVTKDIHHIDSTALASEAGNPRTENVVLLGAASSIDGFPLTAEQLVEAIKSIVPGRTVEQNVKAFELGVGSI